MLADGTPIARLPLFVETPEALRRRFNRGDYWRRALEGQFTCCYRKVRPAVAVPHVGPPGTLSCQVGYLDRHGLPAFVLHYYLRPDGTLGASGTPDPKWLREEEAVYVCDRPRGA